MAAGLAGNKLLVLIGAGAMGSVVLNNPQISDILKDVAKVVARHLRQADKGDGGEEGSDSDVEGATAALTAQVRRLSLELRQLAMNSQSRAITVVNAPASSRGSVMSLILPIAVVGAAGYGYMWWKGWRFGDLMYVTKRRMDDAVTTMKSQMENVSSALQSAKKHMVERLQLVSGKLDEQGKEQAIIKRDVGEVKGTLNSVGSDVVSVRHMVTGLDSKMEAIEEKQNLATTGIILLCRFVSQGMNGSPDILKSISAFSQSAAAAAAPQLTRHPGVAGSLGSASSSGLKELEFISTRLESTASNPSIATAGKFLPSGSSGSISVASMADRPAPAPSSLSSSSSFSSSHFMAPAQLSSTAVQLRSTTLAARGDNISSSSISSSSAAAAAAAAAAAVGRMPVNVGVTLPAGGMRPVVHVSDGMVMSDVTSARWQEEGVRGTVHRGPIIEELPSNGVHVVNGVHVGNGYSHGGAAAGSATESPAKGASRAFTHVRFG